MSILVNKPQFDMAQLKAGTAVRVESIDRNHPWYGFKHNCLIKESNPLVVYLCYIKDDGSTNVLPLPIAKVSSGIVTINIMEAVKTKVNKEEGSTLG